MRSIHKTLGKWKCKILDEWPYKSRVAMIPDMREKYSRHLRFLPPINSSNRDLLEIHMLCGHRDLDMGMWASWSLMRFVSDYSKLVVHCDGTLTPEDVERWNLLIPGLRVIDRSDADRLIADTFRGKADRVYDWRCSYTTSPQLVDAHQYGSSRKLVIMDSDVLVFREPIELIEAVNDKEVEFAWCEDLREAYSAPSCLLEQVTGIQMPYRFNCGFLMTRRLLMEDYLTLNEIMNRIALDGRIDLGRYWACQTYYAMIAALSGRARMLPARYATKMGITTQSCVLRHYVGIPSIRFRYFTEGVERIISEIETSA